jgi:hypothetical protein
VPGQFIPDGSRSRPYRSANGSERENEATQKPYVTPDIFANLVDVVLDRLDILTLILDILVKHYAITIRFVLFRLEDGQTFFCCWGHLSLHP